MVFLLNDKDIEEYYCPTHGGNGNPECSICWENLERLIKDMNGYQTGDNPINKRSAE